MIFRHLLTEEYLSQPISAQQSMFDIPKLSQQTAIKVPCLYRNSNFFGRSIKMITFVGSILIIFWIICTCLALTIHSWPLIRLISVIVILILSMIVTYMMASIWCTCCMSCCCFCCMAFNTKHTQKQQRQLSLNMNYSLTNKNKNEDNIENKKEEEQEEEADIYKGTTFRDDFRFRLELTIGFLLFSIIVLYQIYAYNAFPLEGDEWKFGILLQLIGNLVMSIFGNALQIIIPYYTFRENMNKFGDNKSFKRHKSEQSTGGTSYHVVSLLDILTHKYGFFLFIDQLVQVRLDSISVYINKRKTCKKTT